MKNGERERAVGEERTNIDKKKAISNLGREKSQKNNVKTRRKIKATI